MLARVLSGALSTGMPQGAATDVLVIDAFTVELDDDQGWVDAAGR